MSKRSAAADTAAAGAETLTRPKAIQHPYQPQTATFAQAPAHGFDSVAKSHPHTSVATAQRPAEQHRTSQESGRDPDQTELDSAARQLFGEPLSRAQLDNLFQQEQQEVSS